MIGPLIAKRKSYVTTGPDFERVETDEAVTIAIIEIDVKAGLVLYSTEDGRLHLDDFDTYHWYGDIKISRLAPPPPPAGIYKGH